MCEINYGIGCLVNETKRKNNSNDVMQQPYYHCGKDKTQRIYVQKDFWSINLDKKRIWLNIYNMRVKNIYYNEKYFFIQSYKNNFFLFHQPICLLV
jgi:hypothetical protein